MWLMGCAWRITPDQLDRIPVRRSSSRLVCAISVQSEDVASRPYSLFKIAVEEGFVMLDAMTVFNDESHMADVCSLIESITDSVHATSFALFVVTVTGVDRVNTHGPNSYTRHFQPATFKMATYNLPRLLLSWLLFISIREDVDQGAD